MLSVALAEIVTVPATVAPATGAIREIVGGVLSTVTLTAAAVAVWPAASRATAVKVWEPLAARVVSQEMAYGAAVTSAARLAPSSVNCTPATPTLSEAVAETEIVPETVEPADGAVIETAGGVASFTSVNTLALVAMPPGVVTLSGPIMAPIGTVS